MIPSVQEVAYRMRNEVRSARYEQDLGKRAPNERRSEGKRRRTVQAVACRISLRGHQRLTRVERLITHVLEGVDGEPQLRSARANDKRFSFNLGRARRAE
jgi:hypothetical protein